MMIILLAIGSGDCMIKAVYSQALSLEAGSKGHGAGRRVLLLWGCLGVPTQCCGPLWRRFVHPAALPSAVPVLSPRYHRGGQADLPADLCPGKESPPGESLSLQLLVLFKGIRAKLTLQFATQK